MEQCLAEIERVYNKRRKGEMVRAYYYALRTAGLLREWTHVREPDGRMAFPRSTIQAQAWVSSIITTARRTGRLDWDVVFDDSRSSRRHSFLSLQSDIATIGDSYFSLNPWRTQTTLVEAWVEKDNMVDLVDDMVRGYLVEVQSVKGFSSALPVHQAAERFKKVRDKDIVVYYHGDCDPSGLKIEESVYQELWNEGCRVRFERLAITPEQARQLPQTAAQPLKPGDSRTKAYRRQYPDLLGYEFDAYPTDVLERELREKINSHINPGPWNEAIRLETAIRRWITAQACDLLGGEAEYWEHAIRHEQVLLDPHTGEPFSEELLELYLGSDDDDDDDDGGEGQ